MRIDNDNTHTVAPCLRDNATTISSDTDNQQGAFRLSKRNLVPIIKEADASSAHKWYTQLGEYVVYVVGEDSAYYTISVEFLNSSMRC